MAERSVEGLYAGRFERLERAGAGGMAVVWKARDVETGGTVALKVMRTDAEVSAVRFDREVRLLAELDHPALVRYVTHGADDDGGPWLAMEWLAGESLDRRLARGPLAEDDCLALARRLAEGLAVLHGRGIVHRDIKPSNIFLVDGSAGRAKLLDFGIARNAASTGLTRTNTVLGTVGYMAPEQARGDRDCGPAADIFSLGCVLFECLSGRPVYRGENAVAILAKVLLQEAPDLRDIAPQVSKGWGDLLDDMLAAGSVDRMAAGRVLRERLATWRSEPAQPGPRRPFASVHYGGRITSVLMIAPDGVASVNADATAPLDSAVRAVAVARRKRALQLSETVEATPSSIRIVVEAVGGSVVQLANGTILVTLPEQDQATDQAAVAATCALQILRQLSSARIALATGRSDDDVRPVGQVIDRAAILLGASPASGAWIDETTERLLPVRFIANREPVGIRLIGVHEKALQVRPLLGRRTPFVGRRKELALLRALLDEALEDQTVRAAIVTAPAGAGKSRLLAELVGRAAADGPWRILLGRADPMDQHSSHAVLRGLLRSAASEATTIEEYLRSRLPGEQHEQMVPFLAELAGVEIQARAGSPLAVARTEARAMQVWLRRSVSAWVRAELGAGPLIIALEDLQWADHGSMQLLELALLSEHEASGVLLATARPIDRELCSSLHPQVLPLVPLSRRSARTLVANAVDDLSSDTVDRLIDRAEGNPFFLEELIRREAAGQSDELPEGVLAAARARLRGLAPSSQQLLGAASLFGERFAADGVAAVLHCSSAEVDDRCRVLEGCEVLASVHEASRGDGWTFRHALVRDAAYELVPPDERRAAHELSARWFDRCHPLRYAERIHHWERAGRPERVLALILTAADVAVSRGDFVVLNLVDRGLALGGSDENQGELLVYRAIGMMFHDSKFPLDDLRRAAALLPPGHAADLRLSSMLLMGGIMGGQLDLSMLGLQRLGESTDLLPETPAAAEAVYVAFMCLMWLGQLDRGRALLQRLPSVDPARDQAPSFVGFALLAHGLGAMQLDGRLGPLLGGARRALELFRECDAKKGLAMCHMLSSFGLGQAGACEEALVHLEAFKELVRDSPALMHTYCGWRPVLLLRLGQIDAALAAAGPYLGSADPVIACRAQVVVAEIEVVREDNEEALTVLRSLATPAGLARPADVRSVALAALAEAELARGRAEDALAAANGGIDVSQFPYVTSRLYLSRFDALEALGRADEASAALREATERIHRIAAEIEDEELRRCYLERVAPNARTLARAAAASR